MNKRILSVLACGVALGFAGPAYAKDRDKADGDGGRKAPVAAPTGGGHADRGGNLSVSRGASPRGYSMPSGRMYAPSGASVRNTSSGYGHAIRQGRSEAARSNRNSFAFGGSSNYGRNYAANRNYTAGSRDFRGAGSGGRYAFASHDGWRHDREYNWHGHNYRWNNNGWFIIDADAYDSGYYGGGYGAYPYDNGYGDAPVYSASYNDDSIVLRVQRDLAQEGYYRGPIDGLIGPGTRSAIAGYQRDNGLRVTGSITNGLLDSLNQG